MLTTYLESDGLRDLVGSGASVLSTVDNALGGVLGHADGPLGALFGNADEVEAFVGKVNALEAAGWDLQQLAGAFSGDNTQLADVYTAAG